MSCNGRQKKKRTRVGVQMIVFSVHCCKSNQGKVRKGKILDGGNWPITAAWFQKMKTTQVFNEMIYFSLLFP